MLRKYNLTVEEHYVLFNEMSHPDVSPYVRNYVNDFNQYLTNVTHILAAEERGEMINRVIVNEWNRPIGMITLYDITEYGGFLATWLGKNYHGKGYNKIAKQLFLTEIFNETNIEVVYLKIRVNNYRSQRAALKLAYVAEATSDHNVIYSFINQNEVKYNLYTVTRNAYLSDQLSRKVDYIKNEEVYELLS